MDLAASPHAVQRPPTWRPQRCFTDPNSSEGRIRRAESEAREAQARLAALARGCFGDNQGPPLDAVGPRTGAGTPSLPPPEPNGSFRTITGMPDVGSGIARRSSDGTVAYAEVDGPTVSGVNSDASGYTARDEAMARDVRQRLVERHPDVMATSNFGHKPNDALFHAEANALMRAAEILPYLGTQVGNPTVRIIDGTGTLWIVRDGIWLRSGRR